MISLSNNAQINKGALNSPKFPIMKIWLLNSIVILLQSNLNFVLKLNSNMQNFPLCHGRFFFVETIFLFVVAMAISILSGSFHSRPLEWRVGEDPRNEIDLSGLRPFTSPPVEKFTRLCGVGSVPVGLYCGFNLYLLPSMTASYVG